MPTKTKSEANNWNPPEHSVPMFQLFTSLDEERATEWTVDKDGNLVAELRKDSGWDDWRQVAKWVEAVALYNKNGGTFPQYEDFVKAPDH